jgi:hypothetical protein
VGSPGSGSFCEPDRVMQIMTFQGIEGRLQPMWAFLPPGGPERLGRSGTRDLGMSVSSPERSRLLGARCWKDRRPIFASRAKRKLAPPRE